MMATSFVGKVRDVRQIAEAQIGEGVADMVKFKAQVIGHEATEMLADSTTSKAATLL